jgi:hypothetical protein
MSFDYISDYEAFWISNRESAGGPILQLYYRMAHLGRAGRLGGRRPGRGLVPPEHAHLQQCHPDPTLRLRTLAEFAR